MNKTGILSIFFVALFFMKAHSQEVKLMIVSDVHVMAPELLISEGEAFEAYLHKDRKMLKESSAILKKMTDEILKQRPEIVIMPGDLTKDGEMLSHKYLKENCLDVLSSHGIKAYVVPGNHDINNPDAVLFDGENKLRVETMTKDNFATFYSSYGYADAYAHDSYSLSYATEISDSLVLLGIDANMYEHNDFSKGVCRYEGRLKPETEQFIETQLKKAKNNKQRVLAFMHHGLVKHWKYQDEMMPGYLVEDSKRLAKKFEKLGLEIIFTGHSHAQDISKQGRLYDVQTGSIVSFPNPYRIVTLGSGHLKITSHLVDDIDFDFGGKSMFSHAEQITREGVATVLAPFFPDTIPLPIKSVALEAVAKYVSANYFGDEVLTAEDKAEIKVIAKQIKPYSLKWSIIFRKCSKALLDGRGVKDNNTTLELRPLKR